VNGWRLRDDRDQAIITHSREDVVAAARAAFPQVNQVSLLQSLDNYGFEPYERERERVQLAILKLSDGSEEKLREFIAVAKRDYRDVLLWAEYPEEARLDTPEKRQRIRNMFEKFGVKPPDDL
jgi:hypothetical protein